MIKNGVTDNSSDSAFTGAWVKYLRLEKGYTQGYVAHGICSISHLSYFENGKKKLHDDQIAAVLKKLDVSEQKLLEYNIDNDIINYYEQTEQVTTQQEKIEILRDKRIQGRPQERYGRPNKYRDAGLFFRAVRDSAEGDGPRRDKKRDIRDV